jgi:exopolysaccharide biosynthesis polyprenyl glycosylphosphotransferase
MDGLPLDYELDVAAAEAGADARPTGGAMSRARRRTRFLQRLLLAADVLAASLGGLLTALIFDVPIDSALLFVGSLLVISIVLAFVLGLYSDRDLSTWTSGLPDAPRSLVAALLLTWPLYAVVELANISEPVGVALVGAALTAAIDSTARALGRGWVHKVAPLRQRTVMVGSGLVADRIAERLDRHTEFGLETIGLVDDDVHTLEGSQEMPKLGSLDQLDGVLKKYAVDRVIIAFSRASHQQLLASIRTCRDQGVAVDIVPRLFELIDTGPALTQIGGLPLISIRTPRLTKTSRAAKRVLDLIVSIVLIALLSPLLLLVAIAIKLDSRGPILFKQIRAGRGGTEFEVFKFRSMFKDADERKRQFDDENESTDGVMFKIKRDPRITRVGRLIRRSSIDELPQLLNVVLGDMSLVGPRPLILDESKYAAQSWHARRLDLRPGITGPWQVSGRSDLPFQEMVRFDYQYVSGWSLARDIEILLATIPVVLSGRGAY